MYGKDDSLDFRLAPIRLYPALCNPSAKSALYSGDDQSNCVASKCPVAKDEWVKRVCCIL